MPYNQVHVWNEKQTKENGNMEKISNKAQALKKAESEIVKRLNGNIMT